MKNINIIDVLNSESFRKAQMNIRGEGAHRLNLLLIFELTRIGYCQNRIECDQWDFASKMGYKTLSSFKKARKTLVSAGVWEYHKSDQTDNFGIKAGYFSLPEKFLKDAESAIYIHREIERVDIVTQISIADALNVIDKVSVNTPDWSKKKAKHIKFEEENCMNNNESD